MEKDSVYTMEYIGKHLEVIDSNHSGYMAIEGKVVDETKNTFVVDTNSGEEKTIPKEKNEFKVEFEGKEAVIDGNELSYRPEDRIKRLG